MTKKDDATMKIKILNKVEVRRNGGRQNCRIISYNECRGIVPIKKRIIKSRKRV